MIDLENIISKYSWLQRESPEKRYIKKLNTSGVIYDIGAHYGVFTRLFLKHSSHVVAFEPNPRAFKTLNEIRPQKSLLTVLNIALGSKDENKQFLVPNKKTGRATLDPMINKSLRKEPHRLIFVTVKTLDSLKYLLDPPSFMKIDVEGHEYDVLLGARETIKEYKPELFIELHGVGQFDKIRRAKNVISFLLDRNYSIYHIELEKEIVGKEFVTEGHIHAK